MSRRSALALALPAGEPVRLGARATGASLGAGVLSEVGNLTLLYLVARVGTGTGFTIARITLLVSAGQLQLGARLHRVSPRAQPQRRRGVLHPSPCY